MIEIVGNIRVSEFTSREMLENFIGYLAFRISINHDTIVSICFGIVSIIRILLIRFGRRISDTGIAHIKGCGRLKIHISRFEDIAKLLMQIKSAGHCIHLPRIILV